MPIKIYPALRNHRNMVRLARTEDARTPYALGTAYGNFQSIDIEERRRQVLDQWGIASQSPRRPEPSDVGEILPRRHQTSLFHRLNGDQQDMLVRREAHSLDPRREGRPGTKQRSQLNADTGLKVESYVMKPSPFRK